MQACGRHLGVDLARFCQEPAAQALRNKIAADKSAAPRPSSGIIHDADFGLADFCYALCRAMRPNLVLETGIGYGVTSAFILQALALNDRGELWSIDLPSLGAEDQAGIFVPPELRGRWRRFRGRTRRMLPRVLKKADAIDLFLHDSLHTARNMNFEYAAAWPKLRSGGILLSDDVHRNSAFQDFVASRSEFHTVAWPSVGVAIKP